jgi:hypothetical protein
VCICPDLIFNLFGGESFLPLHYLNEIAAGIVKGSNLYFAHLT